MTGGGGCWRVQAPSIRAPDRITIVTISPTLSSICIVHLFNSNLNTHIPCFPGYKFFIIYSKQKYNKFE
jgi:hypothetical protein